MARSWCSLLPGEVDVEETADGARVWLAWTGDERVLEAPGEGSPHVWLVDSLDDGGQGVPCLLDGARESLAAVARRTVSEPAHGRARRLVGLPALGTGWGGPGGAPAWACPG
ncbi:MAG: uncharacterized protein JWQ37_739 [Blastococcus sp.]|nr:uncharacterized protein [Blastococcus sp.]